MLDGVSNSEGILNSQLEKQNEVSKLTTNPIKNPYQKADEGLFIDETAISNKALNMYEKEMDIKKFNELAMSDPENMSHEEIIENLFNNGVVDPFSDAALSQLVENQQLWDDLAS